ncbi:hypothetical protein OC842_000356 [Tilletia horrida]|uniref:DNA/RNA-binding domain-containing protein n=1 Tax=Tilletia horrida TaxID=155126 RepID=A0AAN6JU78_9BASI|nr:hypothetical protein OC842_000356 [Tilletia horrida]
MAKASTHRSRTRAQGHTSSSSNSAATGASGALAADAAQAGASSSADGSRNQSSSAQGKDARSSQLAREAKGQRSVLKEYLSSASEKSLSHGSLPSLTGPSSDLEFARKNLRNTYLNLLFACTFTRHAHGVDGNLWVETTHPLVAIYRKHLAFLERVIASHSASAGAHTAGTGAASASTSESAGQAGNGKRGAAGGKQQGSNAGTSASNRKAKVNEYNRVATEYRKFLLAEEVFWQELAARIVHTFQIHEAKPMFDALGIVYDPDSSTITSSASLPASSGQVNSSRPAAIADVDDIPRNAPIPGSSAGMNRIQGAGTAAVSSSAASAAEAAAQVKAATIPSNRDRLVEIVHKAFICCGDLARYRVQILDSLGDGGNQNGKSPAKPKPDGKPKCDYSRPSAFYVQARLLLPDNGNPSNQLAVIATLMDDQLDAVHHYYRALCCRVPFDTARGNLDSCFGHGVLKAMARMEQDEAEDASDPDAKFERGWRPRRYRKYAAKIEADYASSPRHETIQLLKKELFLLHALFYRKVYFTSLEAINQLFIQRFALLVKNRDLTPDQISKVVISGLSASWTTRLWRNTSAGGSRSRHASSSRKRSSADKDKSASTSTNGKGKDVQHRITAGQEDDGDDIDDEFLPASFTSEQRQAVHLSVENQIVAHVLEVIRVLLDVGTKETRSVLHSVRRGTVTAADGQAARLPPADQRVTATFRRLLPALRVAIKWVKGHLDYIQRCKDRALTSSQSSNSDSMGHSSLSFDHEPTPQESEVLLAKSRADGGVVESIFSFWRSLVDFINTLRFAFPWDDLPTLDTLGPLGAPALCLEEDLDMRGFSPTKKAMLPHASGGMGDACPAIGLSQALPNEEQLMRIADLLFDAKVVAESPTSPIIFDDERNAFMYAVPESEQMTSGALAHHNTYHAGGGLGQQRDAPRDGGEHNINAFGAESRLVQQGSGVVLGLADAHAEASSEGFSESTEDVVDLAMRAVDDRSASLNDPQGRLGDTSVSMRDDDDEEEDMILVPAVRDLWSAHPPASAIPVQSPMGQNGGFGSNMDVSSHSRAQSQALGGPRTAQDLLLQVLNGSSPAANNVHPHLTGSPLRNPQLAGPPLPHSTPGNHHSNVAAFPHPHKSGSPFGGSPVPQQLASAVSPPSTLLFGGMGTSSAHSPAGAHHRGSIWSPGPMDMRASNATAAGAAPSATSAHPPSSGGSIWGPPGGAIPSPSPNFAAAQAFVNGGIFPTPPPGSAPGVHGHGSTPGATQSPPPSAPQHSHNMNSLYGGAGYGFDSRGSGSGGAPPSSAGVQSQFDDPFAVRMPSSFSPYPPSSGR